MIQKPAFVVVGLCFVVTLAGIGYSGATDRLRVRHLEVVDEHDNVVIRIGSERNRGKIEFLGADGKAMAVIRLDPDGRGSIWLQDSLGSEQLSLVPDGTFTSVGAFNKGKPVGYLHLSERN
jgi:hypothetical protein